MVSKQVRKLTVGSRLGCGCFGNSRCRNCGRNSRDGNDMLGGGMGWGGNRSLCPIDMNPMVGLQER